MNKNKEFLLTLINETLLDDAIDWIKMNFKEGCSILEMYIAEGGNISWQDNQWWVFEHNGEGIVGGDTIYELILNLESMKSYHRMSNIERDDEAERHYDTL